MRFLLAFMMMGCGAVAGYCQDSSEEALEVVIGDEADSEEVADNSSPPELHKCGCGSKGKSKN